MKAIMYVAHGSRLPEKKPRIPSFRSKNRPKKDRNPVKKSLF